VTTLAVDVAEDVAATVAPNESAKIVMAVSDE
jgi:hypothetical protein